MNHLVRQLVGNALERQFFIEEMWVSLRLFRIGGRLFGEILQNNPNIIYESLSLSAL